METLLIIDDKDYSEDMEEIRRTCVRGIIFKEDKLLLIESGLGELKLPGGGIEDGEDDLKALMREVKEETGYDVIPDSTRPFGQVEEKRLSKREPMIWHQTSRLYFCDVGPVKGQCCYTEKEKKHEFKTVFYPIEEAVEKAENVMGKEGVHIWSRREYKTLLLIRDHIKG